MADDDAAAEDEEPELAKPDELVALHTVTTELFEILRRWFAVPDEVSLDLTEIDSAVREMGDPVMIAALAMRKLQALHLIATPGVRTTTDVVVTIVQDLDRALLQAPVMRLRLAAETTDWDAALTELEAGGSAAAAGQRRRRGPRGPALPYAARPAPRRRRGRPAGVRRRDPHLRLTAASIGAGGSGRPPSWSEPVETAARLAACPCTTSP